jgi:ARG/rhodanese/phosphatase superfamily protein
LLNPIATTLADVNVGSEMSFERLSVVPMTLSNPKLPMDCITLDEALSSGKFEVMEVSEGGQVPELRVVNDGHTRVLLLDGEELIGAKQNRIINLTILVPARANVVIPVSCVEAGRWHRQSRRFAASQCAQYSRARAYKVAQVTHSLASCGVARSDQQWIWNDIASKAARLSATSHTSAMSGIFDKHHGLIDAHMKAFPLAMGQCGAVFLIDRLPVGLEFFDGEAIFASLFPKFLRSYALDAIDTPSATVGSGIGVDDPKAVAQNFINTVARAAEAKAKPFPTVGLGQTVRVSDDRLAAAALVADERVVHLAAFELGV